MTTATKEPKQKRLSGMEHSELEKAAELFVENKERVAELKIEREQLAEKIIIEMKKSGKNHLVITAAGENYSFEVIPGEERLSCKKETRSPQTNGSAEDDDE
jgi:hypothetical protein